jgi:hypothetical protein
MGYLIKAGLGLALFLGAIVLFNVKLVELLETGTCASGNTPYEIAVPCPEGTGTDALLLVASIFAGLSGATLFAFRGEPPWGSRRRSVGFFGLGALAWGLFFTATGATALIAAQSSDTIGAGGELGGTIVGVTFLLMGAPVLAFALWNQVRALAGRRDERPRSAPGGAATAASGLIGQMRSGLERAQASVGGGGDAIGRLERLQKLRESGAISETEFEREKARILAG